MNFDLQQLFPLLASWSAALKANLALAQILGIVSGVAVYAVLCALYVVPWMRASGRATALLPILFVHVFRYIALQGYSAQAAGFPESDAQLARVVTGDVLGATIALLALIALRFRSVLTVPLAWLLVIETAHDIVSNISGGTREHLFQHTNGAGWLIVALYVPMIVVSVPLLVWQLLSRHGEALADATA